MTKPVVYRVAREHRGDDLVEQEGGELTLVAKHFVVGDERLANPVTVASLVASGVLVELDAAVAAAAPSAPEPAPVAKAAPKAANKVAPAAKNKKAAGK